MDVILPYSHRWKSLELEPEAHQDISAVWNLTPEDVPLLETLEITDEMPTPETLRFLSAIPNLHRLSLKYFEAHLEVPTCRWDQITGLCLESRRSFFNLDASHVLELVAQCVNLRTCQLAFPIGEPPLVAVPSPSTSRRITLSHLDALSLNAEIAMTAPFNIQRILDTLVLPGLKTLDLTGVLFHPFNPDTYEPPLAFSDLMLAMDELIGRSSCDLRELFLRFAVGNVDDLLRCLHRCPGLTRLDLHRMQIFQQNPEPDFAPIFSALADTSSSAVLCPNLLHLRLTFCDRTDTDHRALTSLIESRCSSAQPGISRLRTARLTLMRRTTVDAEAFAAAMYPSDVTIVEPAGSDRPPRAAWGIPYEDDGMYP
jgi:hypothetical protein